MIKAQGICRNFGELEVLKEIDLEIGEGEIVAIVGASGAGKSTLLHILGTLDTPDSGQVMYRDQDVFKLNAKALSRFRNRNIGFVFQFHHLLPEFTALENVCIPGFIQRNPEQQVRKRAAELLELLGLSDRMGHKPSQLSGGEQQRVAVARSLVNDPIVVLADEPSGNLDSENAAALHQLFFDLRDQLGQTFVIVTHNQELADAVDRTLLMKDGQLR
ncbi:MAG: ABC transporter ATP-binding protein [Flavobacteriales bacterium]|nr:ABC transporter ATP-binding protein [Flavobacteriales bacterium]